MERIRIPNTATYFPLSLADLSIIAPIASRLLLGATLPGRIVSTAAIGAYAGSALLDWIRRGDARRIDFLETYGADVRHLEAMPASARYRDAVDQVTRLNDLFTPMDVPRRQLAIRVDRHLTDYIAGITGQRVETSTEIRDFMIAGLIFPFALGAADPLTGDVALFKSTGIFEPHVIAHEFSHRKGYLKELEAQALAYLALSESDDPVLAQSAAAERLDRQLWVLAKRDADRYNELLDMSELRSELHDSFRVRRGTPRPYERALGAVVRDMYDARMQFTGQNGISDYDEGFTNFLFTVERTSANRDPDGASV